MKQQEQMQTAKRFQGAQAGPAVVIPFRPLRSEPVAVPVKPLPEMPPAAQRRVPRARKLWGREDGFTVSGTRS